MFTKEGPATEDDSYMGYSVTTGDFFGNGDSGTAVGVPRGSELLGKVILFTSNMTNPRNVTGEQMGAYFGYAVASGDIDGDGLDDLIVGAPMYTVPDNPEMTIETGRVYVIYQSVGPEKFRKIDSRDGESNRGRFGLSLATLGDIDRDGYGDFVVGAPYGGLRGHGAVYIYNGSPTGVQEKYSQVIYAENLDVPMETFGFSVAGGLDLEGNNYPDLVVGAYESGTAAFFRSRPVIQVDSYVSFDLESKLISLDDRNCTLSDRSRVTCLPLRACFKYTGEGVGPAHRFDVQYVLDVKKTKNPRLFFLELEGKNTMKRMIRVEQNQQLCHTVQVYVTPNIRDKLTSLDAEMRISLHEVGFRQQNRARNPTDPLDPILGSTSSRKDSLFIRKNCGPDNVCIPDLQMKVASNVQKYLLGSGKRLELDVLVHNMGEDAFEATYNLKLPTGIDYIKVEKIETMGVPVQCSAPKQTNNNTLRCDIGNPLQKNGLVKFKVLLQPVTSHGMKPIYEFEMNVNTTNPENPSTTDDNAYALKLPIWIETDLRVDGESKPKDLYYNPDNYTLDANASTEAEFGPAMTHNYTIRNQGPSDVIEAEAFLIWPAQTLAGNELLYLLEQPETSGPIVCESANANYLSLQLDKRRKVYSHHAEPSGVYLHESGKTINVQREFGIKPEVLITSQNNSGVSTISTGDLSSGNTGMSFHMESGSHGSTVGTLGSGFRTSDASTLGAKEPDFEGRLLHQSRNNSGAYENRWNVESNASANHFDRFRSESNASDEGYQEWMRHVLEQEAQRRHDEEFKRQREEQERLDYEMRQKEEERKFRKEELRRQYEEKRRKQEGEVERRRQEEEEERRRQEEEEERRRQEEEGERRRMEEQEIRRRQWEEEMRKRQEEEQRRIQEETSRRYEASSRGYGGGQGRLISGDREETIRPGEFGFQLRNVSSTQDLERLFGSLSKSASGYELYQRQGKHYVQFMGRFRTSPDEREFIEFQDGSTFPLQNSYGSQSYSSGSAGPTDSKFLRIEGEFFIDSNGRRYIVLNDGRRFPLQGSFTYTEERTYTLDPRGYQGGRTGSNYESRNYSHSWNEGPRQDGGIEREHETQYTSTHEERRTEERKVTSRVYGRDNRETFEEGASTRVPNTNEGSRLKRESDMISVKEFKKFEKLHRIPRDLDKDPMIPQGEVDDTVDDESDPKSQGSIGHCDSAKCVALKCVLGPLKKDQEVWIVARYRVDARTLKKVTLQEKVMVSTKLVAKVTKQPYIGAPAEQMMRSHEIKTNVEPSITPSVPDVIPLWVVVLSACAGTIILLLLIFLLHKCGFFKRNRPSDAPEREPLNRNGDF
ncbi:Integrin alpha-PS2 [Eufriesea mexicana]|nr:Integrin alpha-PS2 [Eufriesea mexicana]